ncbi:hypothetical protein DEO72_LG8g1056 [Vigna unguiculata]|uniref:Uncharacterized protein n=1 Tax=Vigna unguiculata TaxID=3917 RepID=A0A4D6MPS3_VIGUN|nr:hypothetical protein DEO72_LG8g1056 [Vigna unguiculata]
MPQSLHQPYSCTPSPTPTLLEVCHYRTTRGTYDNHATPLQHVLLRRATIFVLYSSPKRTSMASSSRHRPLQIIALLENHHGCTTQARRNRLRLHSSGTICTPHATMLDAKQPCSSHSRQKMHLFARVTNLALLAFPPPPHQPP